MYLVEDPFKVTELVLFIERILFVRFGYQSANVFSKLHRSLCDIIGIFIPPVTKPNLFWSPYELKFLDRNSTSVMRPTRYVPPILNQLLHPCYLIPHVPIQSNSPISIWIALIRLNSLSGNWYGLYDHDDYPAIQLFRDVWNLSFE